MIYVHIGLRKTGSTSIQRFLSMNGPLLAAAGYDYPAVGRRRTAHHQIYRDLRLRPPGPTLAALRAHLRDVPDRHVVISAEGLGTATAEDIGTFAEQVVEDRPVRIIIYLRTLREWVPSNFNQACKRFVTTLTIDEQIEATIRREGFQLSATVAGWARQFGAGAVRVRSLDPADLASGSLVADFCEAIDLPGAQARADPASIARLNEAASWEVAEYIRAITCRMVPITGAMSAEERAALTRRSRLASIETLVSVDPATPKAPVVRIGGFAEVCEAALAARSPPTPPVQYLTPEQAEMLTEVYAEEIAAIRLAIPDTRLSVPPPAVPLPPRPFLPSVDRVAVDRRATICAAIAAYPVIQQLPEPIRGVLTAPL